MSIVDIRDNKASQSNKLKVFMNDCFKDMKPYKVHYRCVKHSVQKLSFNSIIQQSFTNIERIQSSKSITNVMNQLVRSFTQPVSVSIWYWHQDVMAKRTLMGVWKANGRKSHKAISDHQTRGSLIIEAMQRVVIAMQRMHKEL